MSLAGLPQSHGMLPLQRKFALRATIPTKQNSLWRIDSGAVRTLTWLEDGTNITTGIWGPGDMVGKALSTVDPYQIECLTAVETTLVPLENNQIPTEWLFTHLQHAETLIVIRSYRRVDNLKNKD